MIRDNFDDIERFLGPIMAALSPRERRGLAMKIGQSIRRSNSGRIAANIQPDGSAMTPRKPRPGKGKRGKMFRNLRLARILKVRATPDDVDVGFVGQVQPVAQAHHFGREDKVGKTRDGRTIRARYAARELIGIDGGDDDMILEAIERHLTPRA